MYTPTYNRIESLSVLYGSLLAQTCKDFIWMIIDDGSTDDTPARVSEWINSAQLNILYHRKENGGVHTAREFAFTHIETELLVGVDSDDCLKEFAIQSILDEWNKHEGESLAGLYYPCCYSDNRRLTEPFPDAVDRASYQDSLYKYGIKKEKLTVVRTDLMKELDKAVTYPGEKLIGESYKWIQLPSVPFLFVDECIKIQNYQDDGYTSNIRKLWFQNLNGFRLTYAKQIECCIYLIPRIRSCIKYIVASAYLHDKGYVKHSPRPFLTALVSPVGLIGYALTRLKWRGYLIQSNDNGMELDKKGEVSGG